MFALHPCFKKQVFLLIFFCNTLVSYHLATFPQRHLGNHRKRSLALREVLENTLTNLINHFDPKTLQEFFYLKARDKWQEYTEPLPQYEDDFLVDICRIGNLRLDDNSLIGVYTIAVPKELNERASKKKQFEL